MPPQNISISAFPGEFSSPNPQDCPPGAAVSIVNGALRQSGTIEADRGFAGLALTSGIVPTTALYIDAHNSTFSSSTTASVNPSTTPASQANVSLISANGLMPYPGFSQTQALVPWGWDSGFEDPLLGSFYSAGIEMLQTGWLVTSRGLAKMEQLANLQSNAAPVYSGTTTPISGGRTGQFTLFNTTLNPPCCADFQVDYGFNITVFAFATATANSWLQPNWTVAYRFVVARKDGNGYFQFSEPSQRVLYTNLTGTGSAEVGITVPNSALINFPPDAFLQIYRSQSVPPGVTPSDEMYLVAEVPPASTAAGNWGFIVPGKGAGGPGPAFTYDDISPDTQIYVPLYTNAGLGNGIQASNFPAPAANVMFTFGNRVYYGDTNSQQSLLVLMAGTSTPGGPGLQAGDTITVAGITYTGATLNYIAPNFNITTASTPSVNVRLTALSLVQSINIMSAQNSILPREQRVFAEYISLGNGDEGQILIRSCLPNSPAFTVQTSNTRGWAQNYTSNPVSSNSSPSPGGVYWSQINQPPHVPIANNVVLGSAGAHILAACALRDYAIIFKEDGAWTVQETVNGPAFAPLDSTVHVEAPRTVQAVQNTCFALTSKGVLAVGQYGTENISIPIQREILSYLTPQSTTVFQNAFAVAYEAEAEYWLFLPPQGAMACPTIKVYNLKTKSWRSAQVANFLCGIEGHLEQPTLKTSLTALMLGCTGGWAQGNNANFSGVLVERKSYTNADMQWDQITPVLTDLGNQNNGTYMFSAPPQWAGLIGRGDLLYVTQGGLMTEYIVQTSLLNAAQTAVICTFDVTFTGSIGSLANSVIIPCVQSTITFLPEDAGQPLLSKHWSGSGCLIWNRYFSGLFFDVGWTTELSPLQSIGTCFGDLPLAWGPRPWCKTPWLSQDIDWIVQATIPGQDVRGAQLTASLYYYNSLTSFQLSSFTYDISGMSDRSVRA